MSKKEEFLEQVRDVDNQIAELELMREELYHRLDEEITKEGKM